MLDGLEKFVQAVTFGGSRKVGLRHCAFLSMSRTVAAFEDLPTHPSHPDDARSRNLPLAVDGLVTADVPIHPQTPAAIRLPPAAHRRFTVIRSPNGDES
jgi:hypothetical protein